MTFTLLSFKLLHFISTPSNRSPTCIWFYLRYKIRKIIQSSVLSFSDVLKVANFFLPYLCSVFLVLLGRKPDVRIFSTNYAKFFCLFLLWFCIKYIAQLWGTLRECTLGSYRVLHFYQHKYIYLKYLLVLYKLMPFYYQSLSWLHLCCNGSWLLYKLC